MPRETLAQLRGKIANKDEEIRQLQLRINELDPTIKLKTAMAQARDLLLTALEEYTNPRPDWDEAGKYADEAYSAQQAIEKLSQYV